jgi:hypothetical protein
MSRNTIILIICLVIVTGGLAYYFFFMNPSNSTDVTLLETPGAASDAELSFITLVSKLDPIVFDTSLLSDSRFNARQNIRTAIVPETAGRKDPFAAVGQ